jgi:flagellar motility protein MotE (MotC chaperone)
MNRFLREFRLVPVVLFATAILLVLKLGGLLTSGGYTLASPRSAQAQDAARSGTPAKRSWAQEMLGYPDDTTGSVDKPKPADKDASANGAAKGDAEKSATAAPPQEGKPVVLEHARTMSAAERAVLERLQDRRQELDQRARELDIREGLLTSAAKHIEAKVNELKEIEARIAAAAARKDEAEVARLRSVVTMYENMKAKEAARIFDKLDMRVLIEVASQINPRRMSDILAQMSTEAAERLTVELAARSNQVEKLPAAMDLPKIEGRPRG